MSTELNADIIRKHRRASVQRGGGTFSCKFCILKQSQDPKNLQRANEMKIMFRTEDCDRA